MFWFDSEEQKSGYKLDFDNNIDLSGLDPSSRAIVESLKDVLNAKTVIEGSIVPDNTPEPKIWGRVYATVGEMAGATFTSKEFKVPEGLPDFNERTSSSYNLGSQIIHEILWHISPFGRERSINVGENADFLYRMMGIINFPKRAFGTHHPSGDNVNLNIPVRDPDFYKY